MFAVQYCIQPAALKLIFSEVLTDMRICAIAIESCCSLTDTGTTVQVRGLDIILEHSSRLRNILLFSCRIKDDTRRIVELVDVGF